MRALAAAGLLLALALGACVEEGAGTGGPQGAALSPAERAECLAKGGTVGRGGLIPDEICILPQPDAGKACTMAGDCAGFCLADTMACSPVTPVFGCFEFLDEAGRKAAICID